MMNNDMKSLNTIISFVEGNLSAVEFESILYQDKELENLLSNNETDIMPYAAKGELYHYLIQKNYESCVDLLDIQDALGKFLKSKNIKTEETNKYKEQNSIISRVQPSWLDISGEYFNSMLRKHSDKKDKELEACLKDEIKNNFKSLKKPPKWLQSPQWPIEDNYPLFFIGQIDITDIRHDTACVYIFYNKNKNIYKVIEQSA